jgi:hypothetical protein
LTAFYSRTEQEPNEKAYDRIIHNPRRVIILTNDSKERFEQEWAYLSLYSLTGCFITLTLHMKAEKEPYIWKPKVLGHDEEYNEARDKMLNYYESRGDRWEPRLDFMERN